MDKRHRKKKYPSCCTGCSMMELIKTKGLISNNGCIGCPLKPIADKEIKENCKRMGIKISS